LSYGYLFKEILKVEQIPTIILTQNHRISELVDEQMEANDESLTETDLVTIDEAVVVCNQKQIRNKETESVVSASNGLYLNCESIIKAPPCSFNGYSNFVMCKGNTDTVYDIMREFVKNDFNQSSIVCIAPYNADIAILNPVISKIFHADAERVSNDISEIEWAVGDKVQLQVNCHQFQLANGSEGIVERFDDEYLYVRFNQCLQKFKFSKFTDDVEFQEENVESKDLTTKILKQAYAMTVHKSQGSEWDYVIAYISRLPQNRDRNSFINKELLYTMFSRARIAVYFVYKSSLRIIESCASLTAKDRYDYISNRIIKLIEANV
jgi:hypothetical protein